MLKATHLRDLTNILGYGREAHPRVIIPTLYKLLIELNNFFPKGIVFFLFQPIPKGLRLCELHKGSTRLASASDKAYQLLAHGRLLSPGTPASSTTKTGQNYIAEILLKMTLNTTNQIKC